MIRINHLLPALTFGVVSMLFTQNLSGQEYSQSGEPEINRIIVEKGKTILDYNADFLSGYTQVDMNPGYLPEGDYCFRPAFSGDGTKVLLANAITNNVTVFDFEAGVAIANVDVGTFPVDVACTDTYAIVPCVFSDEVWVFRLDDYSVAGVFETGEQPAVVKVNHDGTRAFVGCDIDDVVEVIDLENMVHEATISNFPIALRSVSWVTGSGRFYYTWHQFLVSPDDLYLVTTDFEESVLFWELSSGTVGQTISGLENITEINFSGDDAVVIAVSYTNPAIVYQINYSSFSVQSTVEITDLGIWGGGVAVNEDGNKAYLGVNGNQTALVRFISGDFLLFPITQTAFWCDNSYNHKYGISGQFRFSVFDFETEQVLGQYYGANQYLGAVSPNSYRAVGVDPGRYEGVALFDFSDPDQVDFRGRVPSGEIPEGDVPYRIVITPDGTKAVSLNNLSQNVSIIDLATNEVEAIIDLGEICYELVITNDSKWAIAGGYDLNTIKMIDLEINELVKTVGTGQRPWKIAIAPDDTYAYVGNIKSNNVAFVKLDGVNSFTEKTISVGIIGLNWSAFGVPSDVRLSPDGQTLLVAASFDDNVKVIDTELQEIVATLTVGDFPLQIAFNGTGSHAIVTNYSDNTYSVLRINGANSSVVGTYPAANSLPIRLKYNQAKDQISIVHLSDNKTILNVEPETGNVISSYSYPAYGSPMQIDFDADGLPLVLTSTDADGVAHLIYQDEGYELSSSPIFFDYNANEKIAVVAEGGGGPDNITVIHWIETGEGKSFISDQVKYKNGYLMNLSPNPVNAQANIKYWINPEFDGNCRLLVNDQNGRLIVSVGLSGNAGQGEYMLDVSGMEAGLYLVTLFCDDQTSTKKMVIE
nr:beta-propeller fold lactonase family protein [Bacteroidota bacterium]